MRTLKIRWYILRLKWITFRLSVHTFFVKEFNYFKSMIKLYFAKREADHLHKKYGSRYHVVACGNGYRVVDNSYINDYNSITKRKINIYSLLKMSFYSTSTRPLTQK